MSGSSERPTARRTGTEAPFSTLAPRDGKQTGPRIRTVDDAPDDGPFANPLPVSPSIPPESLRRPFASLTPQKPSASRSGVDGGQAGAATGGASAPLAGPPPPPSQLFAETATLSSQTPSRPSLPAAPVARAATAAAVARAETTAPATGGRTTTSRRAETTQAGKYGTCREHGTALTRDGSCVLCVREEAKRKSERGWRLIVLLAVIALVAGAAIAYTVVPR